MTDQDVELMRLEAERWLTRGNKPMPAIQCEAMAKEVLRLIKLTHGYDLERKTYYNNFRLVKEDWNGLKAALAKLTPALKAFRESDHSYDRAPTSEGQAVLDAWDEVSKVI